MRKIHQQERYQNIYRYKKPKAKIKYKDIFEAIEQDDVEAVKGFLPEHLEDRGNNGGFPLHTACGYGNVEIAKLLIEAGADVNAQDYNGGTPLREACISDCLKIVNMLIHVGADVNVKDTEIGNTPIFHFISVDVAKALINAGADVNARNNGNCTPLHSACEWSGLETIKLLVEAGAETNVQTISNNTPLHYLGECDIELAKYLVEHGADPYTQNNKGKSFMQKIGVHSSEGEMLAELRRKYLEKQMPDNEVETIGRE